MKEVKTVRVKFSKHSSLIYISHLDLNRVFKRAFRRAGIPMYYSEGFSPHPRFGFALPLSIGISSDCEFVDIKLSEDMSAKEVGRRLAEVMPDGIEILDAYESDAKFKTITDSEYEITVVSEKITEDMAERAGKVLSSTPLIVLKRTKSGEKDTDISPFIRGFTLRAEDGKFFVRCLLCADSANYLNPEYLVKILEKEFELELKDDIFSCVEINRTGVYIDGKEFR